MFLSLRKDRGLPTQISLTFCLPYPKFSLQLLFFSCLHASSFSPAKDVTSGSHLPWFFWIPSVLIVFISFCLFLQIWSILCILLWVFFFPLDMPLKVFFHAIKYILFEMTYNMSLHGYALIYLVYLAHTEYFVISRFFCCYKWCYYILLYKYFAILDYFLWINHRKVTGYICINLLS